MSRDDCKTFSFGLRFCSWSRTGSGIGRLGPLLSGKFGICCRWKEPVRIMKDWNCPNQFCGIDRTVWEMPIFLGASGLTKREVRPSLLKIPRKTEVPSWRWPCWSSLTFQMSLLAWDRLSDYGMNLTFLWWAILFRCGPRSWPPACAPPCK